MRLLSNHYLYRRGFFDSNRYKNGLNNANIVKDLLAKGAKLIPDKKGRTPVHEAAASHQVPLLGLFFEQGIDLNHQDQAGRTALHYACNEYHFQEIIDDVRAGIAWLVGHGANENIRDTQGLAPKDYLKYCLATNFRVCNF